MKTDPTYPIDLITSYLAGEVSEDDLVFLEAWLKADPGNRKLFEDYRKVWLEMERARMDDSLDLDSDWSAIESGIVADEAQGTREQGPETRKIYPYYMQVLKIAAIILVILIPSFFIFRTLVSPVPKQLEASLTVREGKLPDGTSVTLNKGARLEYPSSFRGKIRNVKLTGEAYFEVKHDDAKPFIIISNNVRVEVLGTSFYMNTNVSGNTMEVILNSGSVAVYFDDHKENSLFLAPGEKAEINTGLEKMEKDINTDPNYRAWMTQRFIYNNTPLVTIVADLNKVYHANIRIVTPSVANCLVTATFDHQSVEAILHVIQATLDLNISTNGAGTDISGNKCN
jgi:transmembrane sensor